MGGIQVLHNAATPDKISDKDESATTATALPESSAKQVTEVLALVKELKDARALQSQQTTDIARCERLPRVPSSKFQVPSSKYPKIPQVAQTPERD